MHIDGFSMLPLWMKPVNANLLLGHNDSRHASGYRFITGATTNLSVSGVGFRIKLYHDKSILSRFPPHRQLREEPLEGSTSSHSKSLDIISSINDVRIHEFARDSLVVNKNESRRQLSKNENVVETPGSNMHYRGQKLIKEISHRMYFWHRDTENFNDWDDRVQSSVVLGGEYKLMTTQNGLCLYRFFHLKTDPRERHNIINSRRVPLKQWDRASVEAALSVGNAADSNSNLIRRDVPIHIDVCNGHKLVGAGQQLGNWRDIARYFDLTVLSTIGRCSKANSYVDCVMNTAIELLDVLGLLIPELVKFVRNGNMGHQEYLNTRMKENTCKVPIVSQIKNLNFGSETWPRHYNYSS